MKTIEEFLTPDIRKLIRDKAGFDEITEIRLRVNCPVIVNTYENELILRQMLVTGEQIRDIFNMVTGYSAYAHEESIKNGYISVEGGHRIGFGGEAVIENGAVTYLKNINFLNIRISHQIEGCGEELYEKLLCGDRIYNTLIISPPGLGKTTLLRDLIRKYSDCLSGTSICVIDERNEISGSYMGVPSVDLGFRTDVISGCGKDKGIRMSIRSMSPKIIAVDEIGGEEDMEALKFAAKCGVGIIATIHGDRESDVISKLGQAYDLFSKKVLIKKKGEYICY